jgi:aminoglycoside phosphotransferase (APT) family kinase protein
VYAYHSPTAATIAGPRPVGAPSRLLHAFGVPAALQVYDAQTRRAVEVLDGHVPRDTVTEVWQSALGAAWDGRPVWFHGDVAPGNLLVRDGVLAAGIDFGTCGVGDPACDMAIAWTLLSGASREAFRARIDVDPGIWARGRGWALWKALIIYAGALHSDQAASAAAKRVIDEILTCAVSD